MACNFVKKNSNTACNFIKNETLVEVFPCKLCEIFKNTFFTEQLRTTASVKIKDLFLSFNPNKLPFYLLFPQEWVSRSIQYKIKFCPNFWKFEIKDKNVLLIQMLRVLIPWGKPWKNFKNLHNLMKNTIDPCKKRYTKIPVFH